MKAQVKSYIFRKVGAHWEYIKDNHVTEISDAVMECMANQYRMMGFMKVIDSPELLAFGKVENEIEIFLEKLLKKA